MRRRRRRKARPVNRARYVDACFEIRARTPDGSELSLVDGGLTRWTADLLSNAKERLAISGLGTERLLAEFRPAVPT